MWAKISNAVAWPIVLLILIIIAIITLIINQPTQETEPNIPADTQNQKNTAASDRNEAPLDLVAPLNEPNSNQTVKIENNQTTDSQPNQQPPELSEVVANAQTWQITYESWIGKNAPNFTVTDLKGNKHSLKHYRGKNVMLVFWATWCTPCINEVPHIIALNNIMPDEKLQTLAVSYISPGNTLEKIKNFTQSNPRINYPIAATYSNQMPEPYSTINYIPLSFFINPEGKIKLIITGQMSLGDMRSIINATGQLQTQTK